MSLFWIENVVFASKRFHNWMNYVNRRLQKIGKWYFFLTLFKVPLIHFIKNANGNVLSKEIRWTKIIIGKFE